MPVQFDASEKTRSLYEDGDIISPKKVNVHGSADAETKRFVGNIFSRAYSSAGEFMSRYGLKPSYRGQETVKLEPIKPEDGIVNGYTDGKMVAMNEYVIPTTRRYGKFRDWISRQQGKFGRYIYSKFGSAEKAADTASYTAQHEVLHEYTQLRPMVTKDGKVTKPFRDVLLKRLNEKYRSRLPKGMKWVSGLLTMVSYRPLMEGINEVATKNVYEGKGVDEIAETADSVTSYGRMERAAALSLKELGKKDAFGFYRSSVSNVGVVDSFIDRFYRHYGDPLNAMKKAALEYVPLKAA